MTQHAVKLDGAGFFNSHSRLTCYSCAGATLVRQPYMNDEAWQKHIQEFGQAHPSSVVKQLLCSFEFIQDSDTRQIGPVACGNHHAGHSPHCRLFWR